MDELKNCPKCGAIFAKSKFRDVCHTCFKGNEKLYEKVYQYIARRKIGQRHLNK